MRRFLACFLSIVLVIGLAPTVAIAEEGTYGYGVPAQAPAMAAQSAGTQASPSIPAANPEAVTGATAPADEATREKLYLKDFYGNGHDYSHYYGPLDGVHTDDGTVIEAALNKAEHKTLVFEAGKTYTFGSYVHSNVGGSRWRIQGIHLTCSDVVIEGNGATIRWDDSQPFVGGEGLVLEGSLENPIRNIVIRNLNFFSVNNSRDSYDPITDKTFRNHNLVQLKGFSCENVLVENCTFTAIPNPDEALHKTSDEEGRGVSNIWFYGGARNVTVRDCSFVDVTCGSQESGSNLLFSGDCEWKRSRSAEFQESYEALTTEEQYKLICDQRLQGRVENILVEGNAFEHACHDESLSLWCAEVFKNVLVQNNTFNVHDGDAHVPSTVNFTFGLPAHHDRLENLILTHNDIYAEATWAPLVSRADMGGDLHITDNDLHFNRVALTRERKQDANGNYHLNPKEDLEVTNGLVYAALGRDYVDFSGNRVTYDNKEDSKGMLNLMGAKNVLCSNNTFTTNGPLSYLAALFADDVQDAAGHESIFVNNSFDINGTLKKSLIRGSFRFNDNVVRLNSNVSGDGLFSFAGNLTDSTTPKTNHLFRLTSDVDISGNTIYAKAPLSKGLPALRIYDTSFEGYTISFTDNKLWSAVDQATGDWPLVRVQDILEGNLPETPKVDATGTTSNLYNCLSFVRMPADKADYANYQGALIDPQVKYGDQTYEARDKSSANYPLSTSSYTSGADEAESTPMTMCEREGHSWDEPTYTWSADNLVCTAQRVCSKDPQHVHAEGQTAGAVIEMTRTITCTHAGELTYTAAFSENGFTTQVKRFEYGAIDPDAHAWGAWEQTEDPTCVSTGEQQRVCAHDGTHKEIREVAIDPDGHEWDKGVVTTEPTCTTSGVRTFTCRHEASHARVEAIPATGHVWDAGAVTTEPTTSASGTRTYTCSVCGATRTSTIPKLAGQSKQPDAENPESLETDAPEAEEGESEEGEREEEESLSGATVSLSQTMYVYDGKAKKPRVKKVVLDGVTLEANEDYTVSYSANKGVGTAKAIVEGRGGYRDKVSAPFTIAPKGTTISKPASVNRKGFTVKWKKQGSKMPAARISGYQIQVATNKAFTKGKKLVSVKGYAKTSRKVTKLKPKTKYHVRVRTYMNVSGKTYYSVWSKAKSVTTKR